MTPANVPAVLVIDDKEVNLRLMRAYLQSEPYRVTTCDDPQEALQLVGRDPPDLILLDLMMPVLDGFAVLARAEGGRAARVPVAGDHRTGRSRRPVCGRWRPARGTT